MALYALVVGIDAYLPPVNALYGCRNDAGAIEQFLAARSEQELHLATLYDADATRAAIIDTFRTHLGAAGEGDVAFFSFAGHGTEEPAPAEVAHLEPSGRIQTLLPYDGGRRIDGALVRGIADKELSVLIAEVAAAGAHVAIALDCCHSGHGTRDDVTIRTWRPGPDLDDGEWRDLADELRAPRPVEAFLPGALAGWTAPAARHVALSACRSEETAKEHRVGEAVRGAFSVGLVEALDLLGPRTTYRTLLDTVRSRVERAVREQRPELFPIDVGGLGDARFLDGTITPVPAAFTMVRDAGGWVVDAGLVHGLRPPSGHEGDEAYVLACTDPDGTMAGNARVIDVDVGRSRVEPIGWEPRDVAYRAIVADVPLPPTEVVLDPGDAGDAECAAVRRAVARAGPSGTPSPFVRIVERAETATAATRLLVTVPSSGVARISRADGIALVPDVPVVGGGANGDDDHGDGDGDGDGDGAAQAVAVLEHIARWEQLRDLGDHPSPLADAVTLVVHAADGPAAARPAVGAAPLAAAGGYRLEYALAADGTRTAPHVFVDVRNGADEDLYVAVIDLTDRFRCHAVMPTVLVAAGHTVALWEGAAIPVELPAGRAVEPGARAQDWLKVIVSDEDFDASAFDLPALGEPPRPTSRAAPVGTLERLAARAISRDVGSGPARRVARWSATTVAIETAVGR